MIRRIRTSLTGLSLVLAVVATNALVWSGCGSNDSDDSDGGRRDVDADAAQDTLPATASHAAPPPDVFTTDAACSMAPSLPATPATGPSDTANGLPAILSDFDASLGLQPAWGTGAIPASASPDVVGAFRFICGAGQLLRDNPIAFPGQPGKSHLHQFYGNLEANACSTFSSLRASGKSTCAYGDHAVNRSAYWTPAMLDGKGNAVQPDYEAVYYKRRPLNDPKCSRASGDPQAEGDCVPIPNGIQFIFGFDPAPPNVKTGDGYFNCDGPGATQGHYPDIPSAQPFCPVGSRILATIDAPSCWDGKNLDSVDHRSHVSYPSYGTWGYLKCDDAHPYVLPTFHLAIAYTIAPGDDLSLWMLSSDTLGPAFPHGYALHGDYKEAWDDDVKEMWTKGCIDNLLNCSGGDLGNGKQIIGAQQPSYGMVNPTHLPRISYRCPRSLEGSGGDRRSCGVDRSAIRSSLAAASELTRRSRARSPRMSRQVPTTTSPNPALLRCRRFRRALTSSP